MTRRSGKPLLLAFRTIEGRPAGLCKVGRWFRGTAAARSAGLPGRRPRIRAGNIRARHWLGGGRARSSRPPRSLLRGRRGSLRRALRGAGRSAARVRQDAGWPCWRKAGAEKSLADINVAQSGDAFLIEQRRLQRRAGAGEQLRQTQCASNSGASGSSPRPASLGWVLRALRSRQIHEAKPAWVVVGDDIAIIEEHDDVIVLGVLRAFAEERAGR